jgi:hypothetical protein
MDDLEITDGLKGVWFQDSEGKAGYVIHVRWWWLLCETYGILCVILNVLYEWYPSARTFAGGIRTNIRIHRTIKPAIGDRISLLSCG